MLSVTVTSESIADGGDWTGEKVDRTLNTLKRREGEEKRKEGDEKRREGEKKAERQDK